MAYGLEIKNDSGNFLIQDKAPSYMFIGKATYDSLVSHTSVPSSWKGRSYYYDHGNRGSQNCSGSLSGSGSFEIRTYNGYYRSCTENSYNCGGLTTYYTIPDDGGTAIFYVYSMHRPIVFSAGSAPASITDTGVTNGEGETRWDIALLVYYPAGDPSGVAAMEVYCFAYNTGTPTGQGLAVFDSTGSNTFDSNKTILNIKDIMTITALDVDGQTLGTMDYTYTGGTEVSSMSKPMWASVDWARWYRRQESRSDRQSMYYDPIFGSPGCTYASSAWVYHWFITIGVVSGFYWNGTSITANFNVATKLDWGVTESSGNAASDTLYGQKTIPLPIIVPIIDGADYD